MSKNLQLHIPVPCHENWNDMFPAEKGKYCLSCQKTVVDFTTMTDQQVLSYFKNAKGNTCGRFGADQLNRQLTSQPERKLGWFKYFIHILIPAMLVTGKSYAQGTVKNKPTVCTVPAKPVTHYVEMLGEIQALREESFSGRVVDEYGNPLPGAMILIKGTKKGIQSDEHGKFKILSFGQLPARLVVSSVGFETVELKVDKTLAARSMTIVLNARMMGDVYVVPVRKQKPAKLNQVDGKVTNSEGEALENASIFINTTKEGITADKDGKFEFDTKHKFPLNITVSYVGYEPKELTVDAKAAESPIDVVLNEKKMEDVVVVGWPAAKRKVSITGQATIITNSSLMDSTTLRCRAEGTLIQNLKVRIADSLKISSTKIYPNPIRESSFFTIEFSNKTNGDYTVLVTDMNGRSFQMDRFNVDSKMVQKQIRFKQPMIPGNYIVTVFDPNGKRLSSQKLIVIN